MQRFVPYVGAIGLGALVAGFLLWLFRPDNDRLWASLLIAGLVLGVFYLGARWRDVLALAHRRGARYGANLAVLVLLVLSILVAVNYLANRHNKRWDLTAAKQYTLSDQTKKILEELDRDIQIIVFDRKDRAEAALELLEEYRYLSPHISVEAIDQEAQPARAAKYRTETDQTIPLGTIVIDAGDKVERVSSATEQDVTNAIIKVLKEGKKKIYFVTGHGEKSIDESNEQGISMVKAKLEESNYEVDTFHPLEAMQEGRVALPDDAAALVVAGPRRDFLPAEIDALREYLKSGGKAVFLLDPENQAKTPGLVALMSELGIELGSDVVIDASGVGQLFGFGPEVPLVTSYGLHPITERFKDVPTVYPFVRTVEPADASVEGVRVTTLLNSLPSSWAERNFDELATGRVRPDEDEPRGPLSLAVAATIEPEKKPAPKSTDAATDASTENAETGDGATTENGNGEGAGGDEGEESASAEEKTPEGRLVVVGDSDFARNLFAQAPVANQDLFLNMINWVAEDEDLISIRPRQPEDRRVFLNAQQQRNVGLLSLFVIPAVILLAGVLVWWERR